MKPKICRDITEMYRWYFEEDREEPVVFIDIDDTIYVILPDSTIVAYAPTSDKWEIAKGIESAINDIDPDHYQIYEFGMKFLYAYKEDTNSPCYKLVKDYLDDNTCYSLIIFHGWRV